MNTRLIHDLTQYILNAPDRAQAAGKGLRILAKLHSRRDRMTATTFHSLRTIDGRDTVNLSEIDRRHITGQSVINGRLVTEFHADHDPVIGHPAGTLVCEQPTPDDYATAGEDGLYSETVTRFGDVFMDRGTFTART